MIKKILLKKVKIIDPNSSYNQQVKDILIENGEIVQIKDSIKEDGEATTITEKNLHISPGLFDFRATFGEPGFETKEDLASGAKAATAGGFTGVAITPNTSPSISNGSTVEYILNKSKILSVEILPIGTISANLKGIDLAEMYDMKQAGAIAFSDVKRSITNPSLLSRALLYTKSFNGLIISFANDQNINHNGQINEGIVSTSLGLEGIPHLAEEIQITRDIYLAEYNDARLHFASISSAKTVDLIRMAKAKNINITSDIAAHQILFTDQHTSQYDTNYKVLPPYRLQKDIDALIDGLKDNTIEVICSDHTPREIEDKEKEFDLAKFGIINLQTAFPSMLTKLAPLTSLELVIDKMAIQPRKILQLPIPCISPQEKANFVLYNPTKEWTFLPQDILSKSKNSPFVHTTFTGKVFGTYYNNQLHLTSD